MNYPDCGEEVKAAHTPGPWTTRATSLPDVVEIRDGEGRQLASVYAVEYTKLRPVTVAETGANAKLIAAAPEMLKAAEDLLAFLRVRYPDEPLFSEDDPNLTAFVVSDIYAAIRKAKGEM